MTIFSKALSQKSDRELLAVMAGTLDHVLRFSSINHKWPQQKSATLALIAEARNRVSQ